jgi:hypothetical protein
MKSYNFTKLNRIPDYSGWVPFAGSYPTGPDSWRRRASRRHWLSAKRQNLDTLVLLTQRASATVAIAVESNPATS